MIARIARRVRTVDNDSGLGLIELLVASLLGLLLMAAVGAAFIQTSKVTTAAVQNRTSAAAASNAMTQIMEVIHLATPIAVQGQTANNPAVVSATSTSLVIYSLLDTTSATNPAPSRVTLTATMGGNLTDTRCVATNTNGFWTFTTCSSTSNRTVAGTFVSPTGTQNALFTYLDANGNTLTLSNGVLPTSSIALVASVIVSVNMQAPGSKTAPVYLQSKTGMPNVGLQTETS